MAIESTNINEKTRDLLPEFLHSSASNLIDFLKEYYRFVNQSGQPSAEISSILKYRNLDETIDTYLNEIKKEIGPTLPDTFTPNRIKLFKRLSEWYVSRGSIESIELFFRIVFSEKIQVYYPKEDVFTPSDGDWQISSEDYEVYNTTNDNIFYTVNNLAYVLDSIGKRSSLYQGEKNTTSSYNRIQDSYFYQNYSYAIRTEYPIEKWSSVFNRLVHPAGFIFFGDVLIDLGVNINTTNTIQTQEESLAELIIKLFSLNKPYRTLEEISSYSLQSISVYSSETIQNGINKIISDNRSGSQLTIIS